MRKNINNRKVLNNKLPFFALFCFLGILYLGCRASWWYFLLFPIIPFLFWKKNINAYQIIIFVCLFFGFSILIIFASQYGLVKLYRQYCINPVRNSIFGFLDRSYSQEVSSFIKLILFNVKTKASYVFYKQTVDLGIVWLFCISGFHISLLSRLITLCFKKTPTIGRYINITIVLFYSYLLNFSYAPLRILLKLILNPVFFRNKTNKFDRIGIVGLIICFLNPCCFIDYGFLLSFLICIGANCIAKLELNSKIMNRVLINFCAFVITIPFMISMNHKISMFTFINVFVFNFISPAIFLYFLVFSWFPFMEIVHRGLITAVYALIGNISFSNIFIYCKSWTQYAIAIYYLIVFILWKIIYLIVCNNKI